jgi:hypothetical protein
MKDEEINRRIGALFDHQPTTGGVEREPDHHQHDEMPPPFNVGAAEEDNQSRDNLLIAALARLLFEGGNESIRLELFTGDDLLTSQILRIRQVLADKRIPAGDNNAVFTLSKQGQDVLLTALANGQTLVIRVTRGTG